MCGRFTQNYTWAEIRDAMDLRGVPRNLRPRYNIAPTTTVDVVRTSEDGRELVPMRWGLIPSWWKKTAKEVPSTFNARAETVADKPMFRAAFKRNRCIVPAGGYLEWQRRRTAANSLISSALRTQACWRSRDFGINGKSPTRARRSSAAH